MSNTDSFIEEVNEEVRRDRLFAMLRKYGWIAVVAVLLIVGGASWNEYRKAQTRTAAQATGDALLTALDNDSSEARAEALTSATLVATEAEIVRDMLLSGALSETGETAQAAAELDRFLLENPEASALYRDLAALKSVMLNAEAASLPERRLALETLSQPGRPFSLIAGEQLALLELEEGDQEAAISRLQSIVLDAGASAGLRQRVSQLIVALGGEPETLPLAGAGQTGQ